MDRSVKINNMDLKEKSKLLTDSFTLANLFNNYFNNITSILKLIQSLPDLTLIPNLLIQYKDPMSIKKTKETYKTAKRLYLKKVSFKEVKKVIKALNKKTFSQQLLHSSESSN